MKYKPGSSGPFGEDSQGPWLPVEDVAYDFLHHRNGYRKRGNVGSSFLVRFSRQIGLSKNVFTTRFDWNARFQLRGHAGGRDSLDPESDL